MKDLALKFPNYFDSIEERRPEIPMAAVSKYTMVSARWPGNGGLEFSESGEIKVKGGAGVAQPFIELLCSFRIKDGKAGPATVKTVLHGVAPASSLEKRSQPGK